MVSATVFSLSAFISCSDSPTPPVARIDPVTEVLHGVTVTDPYRWMENDSSAGLHEWVDAQNQYTQQMLSRNPARERIAARVHELLQIGWIGAPQVRNGVVFYEELRGGQEQTILYAKMPNGERRTIIDANQLSDDGSTAVSFYHPSRDASLLVYGLSIGARERGSLYVMNVQTGELLPDSIPDVRYANACWLSDNSGFYYSRYPEPGTVPRWRRSILPQNLLPRTRNRLS